MQIFEESGTTQLKSQNNSPLDPWKPRPNLMCSPNPKPPTQPGWWKYLHYRSPPFGLNTNPFKKPIAWCLLHTWPLSQASLPALFNRTVTVGPVPNLSNQYSTPKNTIQGWREILHIYSFPFHLCQTYFLHFKIPLVPCCPTHICSLGQKILDTKHNEKKNLGRFPCGTRLAKREIVIMCTRKQTALGTRIFFLSETQRAWKRNPHCHYVDIGEKNCGMVVKTLLR